MKTIVITGASSGIGYSTCELFLEKGYHVFGSVRKKNDAKALLKSFGSNFTPLLIDVTNNTSIQISKDIVKDRLQGANLTALINNAGIAVLGPLEYLQISAFRSQLETNLTGTLMCVQAFLPLLGTDKTCFGPPGRIINISSALGGKIGYPFYGAYCSSKHALEGLSEALRRELSVHGIKVSVIAPGAISTPIWTKAENVQVSQNFHQTPYYNAFKKMHFDLKKLAQKGLAPRTVAITILKAAEEKNPKIRYTFINELNLNLIYITPRKFLDKLITWYLGLENIKK